jgi:hypothetical protein
LVAESEISARLCVLGFHQTWVGAFIANVNDPSWESLRLEAGARVLFLADLEPGLGEIEVARRGRVISNWLSPDL